ncbi:NAD(P)/FAD-dependent oxidoreductase [Rhodococcus wratislaviensis]|uniref:NAD(P)/FAD-dependent oxidoreductase n=1 Tax=Rhodococcus wratislaviensis TaxID=44752 RepID=UPI003517A4D8
MAHITAPVLVVGASMGGLRFVENLRSRGFDGPIEIVGDEVHAPYNRPPLSKDVLHTATTIDELTFRRRASTRHETWRLGERVRQVRIADHVAVLDSGKELRYTALAVATGLRPRTLETPGPTKGRFVLRTYDDAVALKTRLTPGIRVVVIGAGFIGCEVACAAIRNGCTVTIVAPEAAPMIRPLGSVLATETLRHHESAGVQFRLGSGVREFAGSRRVEEVVLSNGTVIDADIVVEAVGSIPNVEWLDGNELDLSDGVLCDHWMRVEGLPDVVAIGDVARFPNLRFDDIPRRVEHWSMPTETARRAAEGLATHLAGQPLPASPFTPLPHFWSDQYGYRVQGFGTLSLAEQTSVLESDSSGSLVVGYFKADRLVGVAGIHPRKDAHKLLKYRADVEATHHAA